MPRKLLRARGANALAEFALILPLFLLVAEGIVDIGGLLGVSNATNRLATQVAMAWSNCAETSVDVNGVCSSELPSYTSGTAIANVVPQLNLANLTLTMAEFTVTSSGTATAIYTGGYPSVNATQLADAKTRASAAFTLFPGPASVQYVVVVEVSYTHTLQFFSGAMTPLIGSALKSSYVVAQLKS